MMSAQPMEKPKNNPLVEPWNTPFNTPPFEEIKEEHYLPAFQYAFAQAKDELYRIKAVKMKPTFANTVAKERKKWQPLLQLCRKNSTFPVTILMP